VAYCEIEGSISPLHRGSWPPGQIDMSPMSIFRGTGGLNPRLDLPAEGRSPSRGYSGDGLRMVLSPDEVL